MIHSPLSFRLSLYGFAVLQLLETPIRLDQHVGEPCSFFGVIPKALKSLIHGVQSLSQDTHFTGTAVVASFASALRFRKQSRLTPMILIQPMFRKPLSIHALSKLVLDKGPFPGLVKNDPWKPLAWGHEKEILPHVTFKYSRHPKRLALQEIESSELLVDEVGTIYTQESIAQSAPKFDQNLFFRQREFLGELKAFLSPRLTRKVWAVCAASLDSLLWFERDLRLVFRGRVSLRSMEDLPIETKTMSQFYLLKDFDLTWYSLSEEASRSVSGIIHLDNWEGCEDYRNYRVSAVNKSRHHSARCQAGWISREYITGWAELNLKGRDLLFQKTRDGWHAATDGEKHGRNETTAFYKRYKALKFLRS